MRTLIIRNEDPEFYCVYEKYDGGIEKKYFTFSKDDFTPKKIIGWIRSYNSSYSPRKCRIILEHKTSI